MFAVKASLFWVKNWISNSCLYDHYAPYWLILRLVLFQYFIHCFSFSSLKRIMPLPMPLAISFLKQFQQIQWIQFIVVWFFFIHLKICFPIFIALVKTIKKIWPVIRDATQWNELCALNFVSIHLFQGSFSWQNDYNQIKRERIIMKTKFFWMKTKNSFSVGHETFTWSGVNIISLQLNWCLVHSSPFKWTKELLGLTLIDAYFPYIQLKIFSFGLINLLYFINAFVVRCSKTNEKIRFFTVNWVYWLNY